MEEAVGVLHADLLALHRGPLAHALLERREVLDLALVAAQRPELAADRRRDVDVGVRAVGPEEVQAPHDLLVEAALREPREGHRVARGRVAGVGGGPAGGPVVRVVDPGATRERVLRVRGEDGVRTERSDLADEVLAQDQVVDEAAVRHVQERDALVADDLRGRPLLALADRSESSRRPGRAAATRASRRSEEHTSEAQARRDVVSRLLLEKKK